MILDCTTENGKKYIRHQMACIKRFANRLSLTYGVTPGDQSADIDAILMRKGEIAAVAEIKTRNNSLADMEQFGSYLITHEKLEKLARASRALCVPGILIVYLLKDNSIIYIKISNNEGRITTLFTSATTKTQATCNGGEAERYNAYLPITSFRILPK